VPRWGVILGATIGWAVALAAFAASRHPAASVATFALGGLLWVPFIPVAYTMVQDEVDADEQQPMITLWNAILQGVAPLSLAASGALVAWFGATQTLWLSAETTLVLAAVAVVALMVAHVRAGRRARATGEAGAP
jgi:hypothetical protein